MKNLLLLSLIILSFGSWSQKKFTISGKMMYLSTYQGGAQLPDDYFQPSALVNHQLVLVRFVDGDSVPQIVKTFSSDSEGNFSLQVAPGKYGFVAVNDSIVAHQFLPTGFYNQGEMFNGSSSSWTINDGFDNGPVMVADYDVKITLTHHQHSWCGLCP